MIFHALEFILQVTESITVWSRLFIDVCLFQVVVEHLMMKQGLFSRLDIRQTISTILPVTMLY